jgi:hypothetical protein
MGRELLMAKLTLALSVALAGGCYPRESCNSDLTRIVVEGPGRTSFAIRRWRDASQLSYDSTWMNRGTIVNRSMDFDCTAALYRFTSEPRREDLPALQVGDVAPMELPGGGVLVEQHFLPRTGEHRFTVSLEEQWNDLVTAEEWLVGLTCFDADLEIWLEWDLYFCREGDEPPSRDAMGVKRIW